MKRTLRATGRRIIYAPLDTKTVSDGGILLGRHIESPLCVVLSVGPECGGNAAESGLVDALIDAARRGDAFLTLRAANRLAGIRKAGRCKDIQEGDVIQVRRKLGLEFQWTIDPDAALQSDRMMLVGSCTEDEIIGVVVEHEVAERAKGVVTAWQ